MHYSFKHTLVAKSFAVFLGLLLAGTVSAWTTRPSGTPSAGNNTSAPIHVGGAQIKSGGLDLGSLTVQGGSIFTGSVTTLNRVVSPQYCIGGSCITSWPSGGTGSQWTTSGPSIYYNGGNVGINNAAPNYKLAVNGDMYANGGWVRVSGNQGLFFESWGGGWYMQDSTWIRSFGGKPIYMDAGFDTGGASGVGCSGGLGGGYTFRVCGSAIVNSAFVVAGELATYTDNWKNGYAQCRDASTGAFGRCSNGQAYNFTFDNDVAIGRNLNLGGGIITNALTSYGVVAISAGGNLGLEVARPGVNVRIAYNSNGVETYNAIAGGAFYYISDRSRKEHIEQLTGGLDTVLRLRGVTFDWKAGTPQEGKHDIGFIAQEVEEVVPGLVMTNSDGVKTVDYGRVTSLLVEAVKEQQRQIEALRAEVEALKADK